MLSKQNLEKQKEMRKDVERLVKNKEQYEQMKLDLEKLKLEKKRLLDLENNNEKQYMSENIKKLDDDINKKISDKKEELDNWNKKMDNLLNDKTKYYNEIKELMRTDIEDKNAEEKEK